MWLFDQCDEDRQSRILATGEVALHAISRNLVPLRGQKS
jgi:hypothetical protein